MSDAHICCRSRGTHKKVVGRKGHSLDNVVGPQGRLHSLSDMRDVYMGCRTWVTFTWAVGHEGRLHRMSDMRDVNMGCRTWGTFTWAVGHAGRLHRLSDLRDVNMGCRTVGTHTWLVVQKGRTHVLSDRTQGWSDRRTHIGVCYDNTWQV